MARAGTGRRLALCSVLICGVCACGGTGSAPGSAPRGSASQAPAPPASPAPSVPTAAQIVASACASSQGPSGGQATTSDASFATRDPALFAWLLFLSINCPANPGLSQPVIWETWKPDTSVYLPGGAAPAPWSAPLPPRMLLDQPEIDGYTLLDDHGLPVLNEIRLNQATFEYVVQRQLYSKAGQLAFFTDPHSAPVVFPADAMEIKAAWLILTPGDPANANYYSINASYVDGAGQTHQVLAGLAGLHISSKILPNWFWTTFEQEDNQETTQAPQTVPIAPDVHAVNAAIHAALPTNSIWRHYNQRGAQIDFTGVGGTPTLLSDTLLETRFQKSSSCITCHALSTRGSEQEGRVAFFRVGNGMQGYVGTLNSPSNKYFDPFQKPVCYSASVPGFTDCNPTRPAVVYKMLDFVWSLREAQ